MEAIELSREELYDPVWAKPVSRIADEFNIKETDLRKICLDLNISLTNQGYLSRIKFCKSVIQVLAESNYMELSVRRMERSRAEVVVLISPETKVTEIKQPLATCTGFIIPYNSSK